MLEQLANIGEVVGAIAVVVSLVYVAMQIGQNTRAIRANTFQSIVDSLTNGIADIARDPETTRIWISGLTADEELRKVERGQFRLLILMAVRKWENAFYQTQQGTLEKRQWEGISQDIRSIVTQPGFLVWWDNAPDVVSREFREYIQSEIDGAAIKEV